VSKPLKVMIVAVEASADALGAGLARALTARLGPAVELIGVGGVRMAEAGVASPIDIGELSLVGLFEIASAVPRALGLIEETVRLAEAEGPDIAVLIDSWEFTWRVARRLRLRAPATRLVKYVAPQVWATRPGRARAAARLFDRMLTLFPFETQFFAAEGLPSVFVGAPALQPREPAPDGALFRASLGLPPDAPLLLLLPGSRPSEIRRLMPVFAAAARRLLEVFPGIAMVLPAAPTVAGEVRARAARWPSPPVVIEGEAAKQAAMRGGTLAVACSGTVTSELASAGCPMIVAYRANPATALVARLIIRTRHLTLINIAAGRSVAPEFLQGCCTGRNLAAAAAALLADPSLRARQAADQSAALRALGSVGGDPYDAAAEAVLGVIDEGAPSPEAPIQD